MIPVRAVLKQAVSRLAADYTVLQDEEELFKIRVPFSMHQVTIEVSNAGGLLCTMQRAVVGDAPLIQRNMYRIFSTPGCETGYIARRRRYYKLLEPDAFDMSFYGYGYTAYEISLWRDGTYFPIYENGTQVAMVHKGTKVRNNLDEYELYALDSRSLYIAVLFTSYVDVLKYRNMDNVHRHKVEVRFGITLSGKARTMLDRSFVDKC